MGWLLALLAGLCLYPSEDATAAKGPQLRWRAIDRALCNHLRARSGVFDLATGVLGGAYPEIDWRTANAPQRHLARAVMLHISERLRDRAFVERCRR